MNRKSIRLLATIVSVVCVTQAQAVSSESIDIREVSYALGYQEALANEDLIPRIDLEAFHQGFRASYNDADPLFSENDMHNTLVDFYETDKQRTPKISDK
ncbi:FKBP-type peptidyl-prolyl cis-trans isomerase N-terminal domain-containing protein [Psychrobacter sp. M13]|uniref:FKBP-type peptidyl-prolyl cis-trans isomerase N-terminal domain-containing protein n=1 Tax=Psychrobacter sp. M13 TaxID=3067275 RepID=UPI00273C03BD|nr:FKBP-type peptidyl-prolyl cis-trans isomerase N-terminal domain-containing protein [Psychrobacter sp. M13]WLP95134.1 FKBP-type peptidyl-prolyl cis-trans isomerase N-terminal domain-containing protein [Psychrobacter sp. M13]